MDNFTDHAKTALAYLVSFFWIALGAFLAAFAIEIFFIPNNLIDGGVVGLAMIAGKAFGSHLIPLFLFILNLPFIVLAYKYTGKQSVIQIAIAILFFTAFLIIIPHVIPHSFKGENLEVVVIGGAVLGIGIGLIIRNGGCLDGTEILGIIINRKWGFTVGQVVFACNIFVFGLAGFVFHDWHPPIQSLIAYIVVIKIMDAVIVGLDETKSVLIISRKSKEISQSVMHEMGLGLTIMYGRGGYSGDEKEILYVIVERLQLADLKDLIFSIDTEAFVAVEDLHEVSTGMQGTHRMVKRKRTVQNISQKIFHSETSLS